MAGVWPSSISLNVELGLFPKYADIGGALFLTLRQNQTLICMFVILHNLTSFIDERMVKRKEKEGEDLCQRWVWQSVSSYFKCLRLEARELELSEA